MKKAELFQINYAEGVVLDENAVIIDFPSNAHQGMFENYHILKLPSYIADNAVDAEYVGIVSERLKEKTGLDSTQLLAIAADLTSEDDALIYFTANYVSPALRCIHTNIPKILTALARAGKINYQALMYWQPSMSNYWLLKTDKLKDFVDYMQAVVDEMDSNVAIQELLEPTVQYREQEYPMKVFVLEYLFGLWCAERKLNVKKSEELH